jgi:hypothetical protein
MTELGKDSGEAQASLFLFGFLFVTLLAMPSNRLDHANRLGGRPCKIAR